MILPVNINGLYEQSEKKHQKNKKIPAVRENCTCMSSSCDNFARTTHTHTNRFQSDLYEQMVCNFYFFQFE